MSDWKPIDTPPDEGLEVWLTGVTNDGDGNPIRWVSRGFLCEGRWLEADRDEDGFYEPLNPPTHWMPFTIPTPPPLS